MSWKQQNVSMPMGSAGIVGMSSDMKISGKEIDPKMLAAVTIGVVLIVKIVGAVSTV